MNEIVNLCTVLVNNASWEVKLLILYSVIMFGILWITHKKSSKKRNKEE